MSDTPINGTYRLHSIERRLDRIEQLEPAVMRQEIRDVKDDIHDLVKEIAGIRKLFIGFILTFAITSVSIVVLILTGLGHHP